MTPPIKVTFKKGYSQYAHSKYEPWRYGWIVGFVPYDDTTFAIVQTEHGEFEEVLVFHLQTKSVPND